MFDATACSTDDTSLNIEDHFTIPGTDPTPAVTTGGDTTAPVVVTPVDTGPPPRCNNVTTVCEVTPADILPYSVTPDEPTDPITVTDLVSFTPEAGTLVVQPDGWGLEGHATNFYATAGEHTQDGELLDAPVEVRWTPVSYVFDYGDGTTTTVTAAGGPWAEGEELTDTATSHVYEERGEYTASAVVEFAAAVQLDGAWITVPGTVTASLPAVSVQIYRVDTVLVRGDCNAFPNDPGCPGWDPPE